MHTPLLGAKSWEGAQSIDDGPQASPRIRPRSRCGLPSRRIIGPLSALLAVSLVLVAFARWRIPEKVSLEAICRLRPSPAATPCNPFDREGILNVGLDTALNVSWSPFDPTCPSSHLVKPLRLALSADANVSDAQLRLDYPWMVNRTVLKLGDSVDRYHIGVAATVQWAS